MKKWSKSLAHSATSIIAEVIATGINKEGLEAARARVVRDRKAHNPGPPLEPGPFALVVDILERSRGRGILGEAGSPRWASLPSKWHGRESLWVKSAHSSRIPAAMADAT